jgi:hypothetical protein
VLPAPGRYQYDIPPTSSCFAIRRAKYGGPRDSASAHRAGEVRLLVLMPEAKIRSQLEGFAFQPLNLTFENLNATTSKK